MIHDNLIDEYNESVGMLFDMSIERYDFEGSIIIGINNNTNKKRKVFTTENNKWFLSSNETLWKNFDVLRILNDYQFL